MKTLLLIVLSAFALCALLVTVKFRYEDALAPRTSGVHGELQQQHVDVVFVGSSHTRLGYDMRTFERVWGKSAFAVAYDGLDLVSMRRLVEAMLRDPAKRPHILVLEANSSILAQQPGIEDPRLFFDAPAEAKTRIVRDYLEYHHGEDAYLDIWTLVANRGSDLLLTWPLLGREMNQLSYKGSYLHRILTGVPAAEFASFRLPVVAGTPNAAQVAAFHAMAAELRADHVQTVLDDPPMPEPVEAQPQIHALQQAFAGLAASEHLPLIQGGEEFAVNDPRMFADSNHLSTAGREAWTRQFAAELEKVAR